MDRQHQSDLALAESDRMRILSSEYRQLGFPHLARYLKEQADAAIKWASKQAS